MPSRNVLFEIVKFLIFNNNLIDLYFQLTVELQTSNRNVQVWLLLRIVQLKPLESCNCTNKLETDPLCLC